MRYLASQLLWIFFTLSLALPAPSAIGEPSLRVGLTGKYPPFNFIAPSGELTGFDVDFAKEVCREIHRKCDFKTLQWDGIISALLSGQIDAIIGSMAVTPERSERVIFSPAYYESGAQLFLKDRNLSPESEGFRIGVTLGTTYGQFAKEAFPQAKILTFKGDVEILQDIQAGRVDAIVTDKLVGQYMMRSMNAKLIRHGEPLYLEKMAIPVAPNQPELAKEISAAVTRIRSSPRYDEILDHYFGDVGAKATGFQWGLTLKLLVQAAVTTLEVSVAGLTLGIFWALFLSSGVLFLPGVVRRILSFGVDFIRSTPFMIQLFTLYFGLPAVGITLGPWWAAILAIGIHSSAYLCEIFKTAYQAIPHGQHQAAYTLGLTRKQSLLKIILPQMIPASLPPSLNTVVAMVKDSAIVSVISVHELTMQTQQLISASFRPVELYALAALLYFAISYPLLWVGRRMEADFRRRGLLHA